MYKKYLSTEFFSIKNLPYEKTRTYCSVKQIKHFRNKRATEEKALPHLALLAHIWKSLCPGTPHQPTRTLHLNLHV